MANQHTKRAAAAAKVTAKKPAPRKRVGVSLRVSHPAPFNDDAFQKELAALFARQGISIHGFSAIPINETSPAELLERYAEPLRPARAPAPAPAPQIAAAAPKGEIPAGLESVSVALNHLESTIAVLSTRLSASMRDASPQTDSKETAVAGPSSPYGQWLDAIERRVWALNSTLIHVEQRLES